MKIILTIQFTVFIAVFEGSVINPVFPLEDIPVVKVV
jgi:hypothetical protein